MSVTAHILGSCPIGADAQSRVIDLPNKVFGHSSLFGMNVIAVIAVVTIVSSPRLEILVFAGYFFKTS